MPEDDRTVGWDVSTVVPLVRITSAVGQTRNCRLGRAADTISLHSDDMKGKGEEWQSKYR